MTSAPYMYVNIQYPCIGFYGVTTHYTNNEKILENLKSRNGEKVKKQDRMSV